MNFVTAVQQIENVIKQLSGAVAALGGGGAGGSRPPPPLLPEYFELIIRAPKYAFW